MSTNDTPLATASPEASSPNSATIQQHLPAGTPSAPRNISQGERLASLAGGAALAISGLTKGRLSGLTLTGLGAALLYRGVTGHCHGYSLLGIDTSEHSQATAVPAQQGVKVERSIVVNRSPQELYAFWSQLERLPEVMRHIKRVEQREDERSHWVAELPGGRQLEWDAEVINRRENELIAWRSLPGSDLQTAGSVHFTPLGHDRGTAVALSLKYNPPGGKLADRLASLLGHGLKQEVAEDLRRFKSQMEAGEIPTHG